MLVSCTQSHTKIRSEYGARTTQSTTMSRTFPYAQTEQQQQQKKNSSKIFSLNSILAKLSTLFEHHRFASYSFMFSFFSFAWKKNPDWMRWGWWRQRQRKWKQRRRRWWWNKCIMSLYSSYVWLNYQLQCTLTAPPSAQPEPGKKHSWLAIIYTRNVLVRAAAYVFVAELEK